MRAKRGLHRGRTSGELRHVAGLTDQQSAEREHTKEATAEARQDPLRVTGVAQDV